MHRGLRAKQRQQMCIQILVTVDIRLSFIFQLDSVHPSDLWSKAGDKRGCTIKMMWTLMRIIQEV